MEPATPSVRQVQFKELDKERTFSRPELQTLADANPLAPGRKQYRVQVDQQDAAHLSFDTFWEDQLNLYEMFVAEFFCGSGIGSECIRFAVDLARELGKPRFTVRPTPLSGQSKDDLIAWYVHRGFESAGAVSTTYSNVITQSRRNKHTRLHHDASRA
jgi:GNAT superfamily N-acetyltransferase